MPLYLQHNNIACSRVVGNYFQSNGIKVIANIRYGDERTYDVATYGISKGQTIAIGTNGLVKNLYDRFYLEDGFDYVVKKIQPKVIIIYGSITKHIVKVAKEYGIQIVHFRNERFDNYGGR